MDVATISLHDAGIRKAAILVASLDQAAADVLLQQLGPERADLVRQAVAYLDEIDDGRAAAHHRRVPPHRADGARPVALGHRVGQAAGAVMRADIPVCRPAADRNVCPTAGCPPPFDFLRDAEDEKLARLLGGERPPTVALVLSNLPPERAGEVLARLAPAMQIEVVRRLVDLDNTDPETLGEIEKALEARWSRQFAVERRPRRRAGGRRQNPRRVRPGGPRADSRQPRRPRSTVGRAVRRAADRVRGNCPVRRCGAAGGLSRRRSRKSSRRRSWGAAGAAGAAVALHVAGRSETPAPQAGPSRSHPPERR